jgi:exosortase family protein XrtM
LQHSVASLSVVGSKQTRALVFLLLFLLFYSLFHFGYYLIPDTLLGNVIYQEGITRISAELINWISPQEQAQGMDNRIQSRYALLEIVRGCDGAGVLFLVSSAILAFPASTKKKLFGLIMGLTLAYLLNQGRIVALYFIAAYQYQWFLPTHTYLFPTLIIILCSLFFLWWADRASSRRHARAQSA